MPEDFDMNYDYITKLTFKDDKEYMGEEIDGRLWVRELFIIYQQHSM